MTSPIPEQAWSFPVALHDVPETGRHFDLAAAERTRDAVAKLAAVRAVLRLEASFDVTRRGRDGLHVVGRVSATVGQVCVVTLEPIENAIEEGVDLVFEPPAVPVVVEDDQGGAPVEVPTEDAPEALINGVVDLGAVATEFLILGIDPYSRKSDAVFEPPAVGDDSGHPFAALAALRKGERGHGG